MFPLLSWFRDAISWHRWRGQEDPRLRGAWIPDSREPDHPYLASLVLESNVVWYVVRQPDGLHRDPNWYRLIGDGWLLEPSGAGWARSAYHFEADGSLVLRGRRYLRAPGPDDREWPRELLATHARPEIGNSGSRHG